MEDTVDPQDPQGAPAPPDPEVVLKVSASKEPGYSKRIAAAIGWRLREVGFCKARSIKEIATSTLIKGIAICNARVAQAGVLLGADATFSQADCATAIDVLIEDVGQAPASLPPFKVSGKEADGAKKRLANAIYSSCTTNGGVSLKCIGPAAVYRAISACIIAKGLVFTNGLNTLIVPRWESFEGKDGLITSIISIDVWAVRR